jgi:hypothetical protein
MAFKAQALLLSVLALLGASSVLSASASAEPGPFWHHKPIGSGKDEGKIEEKTMENVTQEGTQVKLTSKIGGTEMTVTCNLKAVGTIWNTAKFGQGSLPKATFSECKAVGLKECTVTITASGLPWRDVLMWKYLGNTKELNNINQEAAQPTGAGQDGHIIVIPDNVFLTGEGGLSSETEPLAEMKFGKGCGVFMGSFKVEGAFSGEFETAAETFGQSLKTTFSPNDQLQHYWSQGGGRFVPYTVRMTVAGNSASFTGPDTITAEKQEIAVFEK